jgi:hypothetical protein
MDLLTVLQQLYAAEINVSIESDWDNGFTVRHRQPAQRFRRDRAFRRGRARPRRRMARREGAGVVSAIVKKRAKALRHRMDTYHTPV